MKSFETARMDRATMIYTIIFGAFSAGAIAFLAYTATVEDQAVKWIVTALLLAAAISAYLMIPKLEITNQTIYIKNFFVTIKIPVADIAEIEKYERIGFNVRTFGVGGLFGYFGYFNGNDVWYVTNIKKKIKIKLKSGKVIMISPEDPAVFLTTVRSLIPGES